MIVVDPVRIANQLDHQRRTWETACYEAQWGPDEEA